MLSKFSTNVEKTEVLKFKMLSKNFWDYNGRMSMLHRMNPCRTNYIRNLSVTNFGLDGDKLKVLEGLDVLDIGCGGGLLSESLSRLGANVLGIDATKEMIKVAESHKKLTGEFSDDLLKYKNTAVENLAKMDKPFKYDIICAMELVEHIPSPFEFFKHCFPLLKENGLFFVSTINKTLKSYLLGIIAAEHILKLVPKNTHRFDWFQKPENISFLLERNGFYVKEKVGMAYDPFNKSFKLNSKDLDVNYIMVASKF